MGKYNMKAIKTVLKMACDACGGYCCKCPVTEITDAVPCGILVQSRTREVAEVLAKWIKNRGMKKSDLKDGMICKTREGETFIWLDGELRGKNYWCSGTLEDLTNATNDSLDIVTIYITDTPTLGDMLNVKRDTHVLIWEREETKKMTLEEIEKELGYKVEIAPITADAVDQIIDRLENMQDTYYRRYHDEHIDTKYNEGRADAMEVAIKIVNTLAQGAKNV